MSAIIQNNFRISNARKFVNSFSDAVNISNFYVYISKNILWSAEPTPDAVQDNTEYNNTVWEEMIAMKLMTPSDVVTGIRNIPWTSGKFYDMYRSDYGNGTTGQAVDINFGSPVTVTNISQTNFYVITSDLNVYKCINNREPLGNDPTPSIVKPTGKSPNIFTTADGYRWKFMYTLSSADNLKFDISDFIPVRDIPVAPEIGGDYYDQWLVQEAAIDGSIDQILITNSGTGYSVPPSVVISAPNIPGGIQATATAQITSGIVSNIVVTNPGSGYKYATVTISGVGSNAAAKAMIPPPGGHGSNAVDELIGYNVICYSILTNDSEIDIPNTNQYRRVGILKNPLLFNTSTLATLPTLSATPSLVFNPGGTGDFQNDSISVDIDEVINGSISTAQGRLVDWDPVNHILRYVQTRATGFKQFQIGDVVTGASSGASWTVGSLVNPDVQPFSGYELYYDNRAKVNRQIGQEEVIRFVLVF